MVSDKKHEVVLMVPMRMIVAGAVSLGDACYRAKAETEVWAEARGVKSKDHSIGVLQAEELPADGSS